MGSEFSPAIFSSPLHVASSHLPLTIGQMFLILLFRFQVSTKGRQGRSDPLTSRFPGSRPLTAPIVLLFILFYRRSDSNLRSRLYSSSLSSSKSNPRSRVAGIRTRVAIGVGSGARLVQLSLSLSTHMPVFLLLPPLPLQRA